MNEVDELANENNTMIKNILISLLLNNYNSDNNKYSYSLEFIFELEKLFSIKSDSYFYAEAAARLNKILSEEVTE